MSEAAAVPLCSQLESEGIPCHINVDKSLPEGQVGILVAEPQLELARTFLEGNTPAPDEETDEDRREQQEYYVRQWVCPECRKRTLKQLPLGPGWYWVKVALTTVVFPPLIALVLFADLRRAVDTDYQWFWPAWFVTGFFLLLALVVAPRGKHCTDCGWRSGEQQVSSK